MPTITRTDLGNLMAQLTITVKYEDYQKGYNKALNQYQRTASFKGFRTGKTPMSFVRKMYGKQLLIKEIDELISSAIQDYAKEVELLGTPIPASDYDFLEIDLNAKKDYGFHFEIGLVPEIDLATLNLEGQKFEFYKIEVDDDFLQKELNRMLERWTSLQEVEEGTTIEADDHLTLLLKEMDGEAVKENGIEVETDFAMNLVKSEALKNHLLTLQAGDQFSANIYDLEDTDPENIRKNILGLDDDDPTEFNEMFQGTVVKILRKQPAQLSEAIFKEILQTDDNLTEEEFYAKFREIHQSNLKFMAVNKLGQTLHQHIRNLDIPLPDAFLKKWFVYTETASEEEIEKQYHAFRKSVVWEIVSGKIADKYGIEITEAEVMKRVERQIMSYFGTSNLPHEVLSGLVENILKEKEGQNLKVESRNDLFMEKITAVMEASFSLDEKVISATDFLELLRKRAEETEMMSQETLEQFTDFDDEIAEGLEILSPEATDETPSENQEPEDKA